MSTIKPTDPRIAYYQAMVAARQSMGKLYHNQSNPHFKSKFANLSAVIDVINGPLLDNGIVVEQFPMFHGDGMVAVNTVITHVDGHSEAVNGIPFPLGKKDAQGIGSAITYARRYALMSIFGLAPEDDDGNRASEPQKQAATHKGSMPQPSYEHSHDNGMEPAELSSDEQFDAIPEFVPPTKADRGKFHALGSQLYGDGWDDKRHALAAAVLDGETSSSKLNRHQMRKLIRGMEAKQAKAQQPDAKAVPA